MMSPVCTAHVKKNHRIALYLWLGELALLLNSIGIVENRKSSKLSVSNDTNAIRCFGVSFCLFKSVRSEDRYEIDIQSASKRTFLT